MKVISFLGPTNYSETIYHYQGCECRTRFFPVALSHFLKPQQMLVCATPTVREHQNLKDLQAALDQMKTPHRVVDIAEGHSEQDLWEIFAAITGAVDEDEQVVFDVTHSFRSLPMLVFLAVAYLKAARQVKVERVLYGAWEARDLQTNRSPVFDLTPFVSLFDWTSATTRFVETGDGSALAKLLRAGMPSGSQMKEDLETRALGKNLRLAAEAIDSVSLALRLARPFEVMQSSAQFETALEQSRPGIQARAKPFALLVDSMVQEYRQFALEEPDERERWEEGLRLQLAMIDWYIRRRHIIQAATLAREWIVSLLALEFDAPLFDLKKGREQVEWALNNAAERARPKPRKPKHASVYDDELSKYAHEGDLVRLWSRITDLRNDIAHAGMRSSPKQASLLKQNMESLYADLERIAAGVLGQPPDPPDERP